MISNFFSKEDYGGFDEEFLREQLIKARLNLKNKNMQVKARFHCTGIMDTIGEFSTQRHVAFRAVYGEEGENASFSKATPWGELKMQIDEGTAAYNYFVPGKYYYLTFDEGNS